MITKYQFKIDLKPQKADNQDIRSIATDLSSYCDNSNQYNPTTFRTRDAVNKTDDFRIEILINNYQSDR